MKPDEFALLLSKLLPGLKTTIALTVFLLLAIPAAAQNLQLKITGASERETAVIDSTGYLKKHPNAKSVVAEINSMAETLKKAGWLETEILENIKTSDSSFGAKFRLGERTKFIHIYIGINSAAKSIALPDAKTDTLTLPMSETEAFLNRTLKLLENKGYSLAKLRLTNLRQNRGIMTADLELETGQSRRVNDIVINGYEKFPEGHRRQIRRMYRNKTFNRETLEKIHGDFEKFRFVNQTRYPEILFSTDTTKIYVYVEKSKPNRFDGFVGFSNDEDEEGKSKIRFNGYLDLMLVNALNTGEQFTIYWKSDGKQQKTFNASIELPYIFRSPLGLKASLNIFKQDSTFQNTKTAIALGYFFDYNTRLYLGYDATESSDIQNQNTESISDFKNAFLTSTFEFTNYKPEDFLFPEKARAIVRTGVGSRKSKVEKTPQFFLDATLSYNFYLNEKNSINLKTQDFYLKSSEYLVSELYRFGGINSIRGFNENSLQANLFTSMLTEYRYVFVPGLYVHSIVDFGYYRDDTRIDNNDKSGNLLGLGVGFGLLNKNGLFNIVYANGTSDGQEIKLSNSIVQISFKASF
jgi:hypothetical protein